MVERETVNYVANIYKYYIAYALSRELLSEKALQLQALEASGAEQEGASKRRLRSMGS